MVHKKKGLIKKVFQCKEQLSRELDKSEEVANKVSRSYLWVWYHTAGCGTVQLGVVPYSWVWYRTAGCGTVQLGVVPYSWVWYCTTGCGTVQLGVVLYSWVWYRTAGCGTVQLGVVLYSWVWYRTAGCGTVQLGVVPYSWVWYRTAGCGTLQLGVVLYSRVWYCTAGCGTLLYSWVWYSIAGCGTVQVGVVLYSWVWYSTVQLGVVLYRTAGCGTVQLGVVLYSWVWWYISCHSCNSLLSVQGFKDYQEKWATFSAPEDPSLLKVRMLSHECQVTHLGLSHASHVVSSPNFHPIMLIFSCCQGNQILQCYNAHNSYLFSIQAYNSRCEQYYRNSLPEMMDVSCCELFIVCELLFCLFTCMYCMYVKFMRTHAYYCTIRTYCLFTVIFIWLFTMYVRTNTNVQCMICCLFVYNSSFFNQLLLSGCTRTW